MLHNSIPRALPEGTDDRVHILSDIFRENKTGTIERVTAENLGIRKVLRRVVDRAVLIDADRSSEIGYKDVPVAHVSILNSEKSQR